MPAKKPTVASLAKIVEDQAIQIKRLRAGHKMRNGGQDRIGEKISTLQSNEALRDKKIHELVRLLGGINQDPHGLRALQQMQRIIGDQQAESRRLDERSRLAHSRIDWINEKVECCNSVLKKHKTRLDSNSDMLEGIAEDKDEGVWVEPCVGDKFISGTLFPGTDGEITFSYPQDPPRDPAPFNRLKRTPRIVAAWRAFWNPEGVR